MKLRVSRPVAIISSLFPTMLTIGMVLIGISSKDFILFGFGLVLFIPCAGILVDSIFFPDNILIKD